MMMGAAQKMAVFLNASHQLHLHSHHAHDFFMNPNSQTILKRAPRIQGFQRNDHFIIAKISPDRGLAQGGIPPTTQADRVSSGYHETIHFALILLVLTVMNAAVRP